MALLEWIDDLRESRPVLAWSAIGSGALAVVIAMFMAIPASPMFEAVGATEVQSRIRAAGQSAYWGYRVVLGRNALERPQTVYGTITGASTQGTVLMSVPVGEGFQIVQVKLANVQSETVDSSRLWGLVEQVRNQNARVDVYPDGRSVVWIKGQPLNLMAIEVGAAKPETNPVTNIVDKAFASYYWNVIWRGEPRR